MDKLTPFQKALLSSVNQEFSDVPQEEELTDIAPISNSRPKRYFTLTLRRSLVAAAVVLVLAGVAFAAVRFSLRGQVEKSIYSIPEYNVQNQCYDISFQEDIAAADAPDEIQTFMLPTALVSKDTLELTQCYLEDEDNCWYPHNLDLGHGRPLDGKVQTIQTAWLVNDQFIYFTQRTATNVVPGKAVVSIHFDAEAPITSYYEAITLGEYEIFCFNLDLSALGEHADGNEAMSRYWFWTDGYYLYELIGSSQEQMEQLFESVAPVEDINAYLGIEE